MTTPATRSNIAGLLLREWRQRRHLSQLDLAHLADSSARHLSYLENGRALPSRVMVLRLAEALEIPLRDVNQMLLGAGHAPAYGDATSDVTAMRRLLETVDQVLAAHDPWPALVLDAHFDIVANNDAVTRLLTLIDADLLDPPINVVRVTLHPRGLARHLVNLAEWRAHLIRQVRRHAASAPSADLDALLAEVESYPAQNREQEPDTGPTFALPMHLTVGGTDLRLYSIVATFGTPLDVVASELAIESFLPADSATSAWLTDAAASH